MKKIRITISFMVILLIFMGLGTVSHAAADVPYDQTKTGQTSGVLNVRTDASASSKSLGKLSKGTKVTLRGYKKDAGGKKWYRIAYDGKKGYVSSSYVKVIKRVSYTIYTPYKKGYTTGNLNIRKTAAGDSAVIGKYKKHTNITLKGYKKSGGAVKYRVTYNGKTGYVSAKYVKLGTYKAKPAYTEYDPVKQGTVTADSLNIRASASGSGKKIGMVKKGYTFSLFGYKKASNGTPWYVVKYNGKTGYVSSKHVKVKAAAKVSYTKYSPVKLGSVKTDTLNIRASASGSGKLIGTVNKGYIFSLFGYKKASNGTPWYAVKYNGKTGYVNSRLVTVLKMEGTYSPQKTGQTTVSSNIRKDASTDAALLGTVESGTPMTLYGYKRASDGNPWYKVIYNNKYGYISSKLVKQVKTFPYTVYVPYRTGTCSADTLNVRAYASTDAEIIGKVGRDDQLVVRGYVKVGDKTWYAINCGNTVGYASGSYITTQMVTSGEDFDAQMLRAGFPSSYLPYLRTLHSKHPKWVFRAQKTGIAWSTVVSKETSPVNRNLYNGSVASWKSMEKGAYDFGSGSYVSFDGKGWVAAAPGLVQYYLDPRNFLDDKSVLMFLDQSFDASTQSVSSVSKVCEGTFLAGKFPESTYKSYAECIYYAGKAAGMNPNVLASMIIQEQGTSGQSGLITGTTSGYKGYYNFLNIGAYTTSSMSAVQRGLWWAKGAGSGQTSYSRPWNTRAKAITGGAKYYAEGYINKKQNTLYLKKFNVMNGASNVGVHQYMTNVQGAASEASLMRDAYKNTDNIPVTFSIPVFDGMPSSAVKAPSKTGNNNNLLSSLKVSGYSLSPSFNRYTTSYTVKVPSSVKKITVSASASGSGASISGTGEKTLAAGKNTISVTCRATSGVTRTYTINVVRN